MKRAGSKSLGRPTDARAVSRRVFVACEGHRSEIDYLLQVLKMSEVLGLNGRVEMIVLDRYETDSGLSHPMHVIRMTADHMEYLATERCSEDLFLSRVRASAGESGRSDVRALSRDPVFRSLIADGYVTSIADAMEYAVSFMSDRGFEISVDLDSQMYNPVEDYVCIVIDRDAGDERPGKSYREFIDSCDDRGYKLFVTNPKFEFWILMHLPDISEDLKSIADDRNPSAATDRVMRSRGLEKGRIDFEAIVAGLWTAMDNARPFTHTLDELEGSVGTNLPSFIELLE